MFTRFPELERAVPFRSLGRTPTPVQPATVLGETLSLDALYIKRDDLAGDQFGGSKVRKLEFLLAEALSLNATRVVTIGGVASNQTAATAMFAKEVGLHAHLLYLPQPPSSTARRNLLVAANAGATMELVTSKTEASERARSLVAENSPKTYLVPEGGSTELGNLAFVNAAFELAAQIEEGQLPPVDVVYIAMGTMGSAVGLSLGLTALDMDAEVVAVRASSAGTSSLAGARRMFEDTASFLAAREPTFPKLAFEDAHFRIEDGQLGRGYGLATQRGKSAADSMRETEGIDLEPTYTEKTVAALIADAPMLRGKVVVFWNTAGPLLDVSELDANRVPAALRPYMKEARP